MRDIHDPVLLAELDLMFAPDGVVDVAGDAGWNCYAKAFTSMWLLRLWGEESQSYEGRLCIANFSAKEIKNVYPHAWAGLSEKRIVDVSIRDIGALRYMTVLGSRVVEDPEWKVYVERDRAKYDKIASGHVSALGHKFLVYHPERVRVFSADSIRDVHGTYSPSAQRTLSRYRENLLPKAVLHVFHFAEGARGSLSQEADSSPWDHLDRWDVDALRDLESLLSDAS